MAMPLEHQGLGVYATKKNYVPPLYEYPDQYGRSPMAGDLHNQNLLSLTSSSSSNSVIQRSRKGKNNSNGTNMKSSSKKHKIGTPMGKYGMYSPTTPSTAAPSMPDTPYRSLHVSRQMTREAAGAPSTPSSKNGGSNNLLFLNVSSNVSLQNGNRQVEQMQNYNVQIDEEQLWSKLEQLDWSQRGIPSLIQKAAVSFKPQKDRPVAIDWSANGMPSVFKVGQRRNKPKGVATKDLVCLDWSKTGLPIKLTYWDHGVLLDWSASGIPKPHHPTLPSTMQLTFKSKTFPVKGKYEEKTLDWSAPGLPKLLRKAVWKSVPFDFGQARYRNKSIILDWSAPGLPGCVEDLMAKPNRRAELVRNCIRGAVHGPLAPVEMHNEEKLWHNAVLNVPTKKENKGNKTTSKAPAAKKRKMNKMLQTKKSRFVHKRGYLLKQTFGQTANMTNAVLGDTLQYEGKLFVVASVPEQYRSREEKQNDEYCGACDWSSAGIPSFLKSSLYDRELAFDWTETGLPGQFTKDAKRDPFAETMGVPLIDWSVSKRLPGEFQKLTHNSEHDEKMIYSAVDWSGKGAPFGKRQLNSETGLDWTKSGIPPEIKHAQWSLKFGTKFVPSPKGSNTITLFKNGFFETNTSPAASRTVSKDMRPKALDAQDDPMENYGGEKMDVIQRTPKGRIPWEISVGHDTKIDVYSKHFTDTKPVPKVDDLLKEVNSAYHQLHEVRRHKAEDAFKASHAEQIAASAEMNPTIVKELLAFNKGATPENVKKMEITHKSPMLSPDQKADMFWSAQLDWSDAGVPKALTRPGSAAMAKKSSSTKQEPELMIDWANCGKKKMPPCFRHHETWMCLRGRKHVYDELAIDWSASGSPRCLFEQVTQAARKKEQNTLMIDWCQDGVPFGWVGKLPTDRDQWAIGRKSYSYAKFMERKQAKRARGWPKLLTVDWSQPQLPWVELPGFESPVLVGNYKDMYEEPVSADFSGKGLPVDTSVFDNLTIDWGQAGSLSDMTITYSVDRTVDSGAMKFNLRKNRIWGQKTQYQTVDTYVWQDGEISPARITKCAKPLTKQQKIQNQEPGRFFSQEIKLVQGKKYVFKQTEEISYINWAKKGVDLRKTVHKDRPYSIDWSNAGLPFFMEVASFHTNGYKFECRCDWSKDGEVMPMVHDGKKCYNPDANMRYWALKNAVPNVIAHLTRSPTGLYSGVQAQRGHFYEAINWNAKGLPMEIKAAPFEPREMAIDWSGAGIPGKIQEVDEEWLLPVDWSRKGMPKIMQQTKRHGDWDVRTSPVVDWSAKGLPPIFRKAVGEKPDMFTAIDWNRNGVPVSTQSAKWEPLVLDWSTHGLPWGGRKADGKFEFALDWSADGLPGILHDVDFFSPETDTIFAKPRFPSKQQQMYAMEDEDYGYLANNIHVNTKQLNNLHDSPWNRTKDEIRGVKYAHRTVHTKNTKKNLFRVMRREMDHARTLLRDRRDQWITARRFRMRWEKEVLQGKFENLNDLSIEQQSSKEVEPADTTAAVYENYNKGQTTQKTKNKPLAQTTPNFDHAGGYHLKKHISDTAGTRIRRGRSREARPQLPEKDTTNYTDLRPAHLNEDVLVYHIRKTGRVPYVVSLGNEFKNGITSVGSLRAEWQQREGRKPQKVDKLLAMCSELSHKLVHRAAEKAASPARKERLEQQMQMDLGRKVADRVSKMSSSAGETNKDDLLVYEIRKNGRTPYVLTRGNEFYVGTLDKHTSSSTQQHSGEPVPQVDDLLSLCGYLAAQPAPGHETSYVPPTSTLQVWELRPHSRAPFLVSLGQDKIAKRTNLVESRNPPFSDDLLKTCRQLLRQVALQEAQQARAEKLGQEFAGKNYQCSEQDLLYMVKHRQEMLGKQARTDTMEVERASTLDELDYAGVEELLSLVSEAHDREVSQIVSSPTASPPVSSTVLLAAVAELYEPTQQNNNMKPGTTTGIAHDSKLLHVRKDNRKQHQPSHHKQHKKPPLKDFSAPTAEDLQTNISDPRGAPPSVDDLLKICAQLYPAEKRSSILANAVENIPKQDLTREMDDFANNANIASPVRGPSKYESNARLPTLLVNNDEGVRSPSRFSLTRKSTTTANYNAGASRNNKSQVNNQPSPDELEALLNYAAKAGARAAAEEQGRVATSQQQINRTDSWRFAFRA
ncbi:unnamed protein product [Amoebophrya sp. A120]|nr:unnamed protein product [Amoebophrya sp. A120]|eukprot:GSA120T00013049001.1